MTNGIIEAIVFIIGLVVSTIIIYIVTRLFGEKEGIARAFITAIIGAVIYGIAHFLLGNGLLSATIGGIIWYRLAQSTHNCSYYMDILCDSWCFVTYCYMNAATTFLFAIPRTCSNENNVIELLLNQLSLCFH